MIYDYKDDEENFLSDKRVEEVEPQRRVRTGSVSPSTEKNKEKEYEDDSENSDGFSVAIIIVAVIICIVAGAFLVMIFKEDSTSKPSTVQDTPPTSKEENTTMTNNNSTNELGIANLNESYDVYPVDITSNVYKKGGNFYNNNEKIKGDKVYVEYKQISGLKDIDKQNKINEKLKDMSVSLYDKNYLSDKKTLFIDIHTKISVNFNTLSYVVYKTYEDIDGNRIDEKVNTWNIRLDTLEDIKFEDLFVDKTKIKEAYKEYTGNSSVAYYFDPKYIYVYDGMNETKIDMSKYYSNIAIYKRYKDTSLFTSKKIQEKVFTFDTNSVSEETLDRAFESSK